MDTEVSLLKQRLSEREKELNGLYKLAVLFAKPSGNIDTVLKESAEILRTSMQFISETRVEIQAEKRYVINDRAGTPSDSYRAERVFGINRRITVTVEYFGKDLKIEERERHLIDTVAALLADVLQRIDMEQVLCESTKKLQQQTEELERKNVALREVLYQIESEKREILHRGQTIVDVFIRPYMYRLKGRETLSENESLLIKQIEKGLDQLFTTSEKDVLSRFAKKLTPREVEICGLIRNGLTSKEIAALLQITEATVERHRNTIRTKMNIANKKINLTSFLRDFPRENM